MEVHMKQIIADYYEKYREINAIIKKKIEMKDKVLSSLLNSKVGKLYFSLNDEQKKLFEEIYHDADFSRYLYFRDDIKEFQEKLDVIRICLLYHKDFPFKNEDVAIYISDGNDIYDAITDVNTKDLDATAKEVIKDMFKYYNFLEDDFTMSDIPLIKVIYEKLKKNNEDYTKKVADIKNSVTKAHEIDEEHITYKENRRNVIIDFKKEIEENEEGIRNSDSGFKYLLLFSLEAAKYEVSLLEGKKVTAILKEIEEGNMSEGDKDYFKDALVKAYYNLTNIEFRKESKYFDNDNDIYYATFETANPEINKRMLKMMNR